MINIIDDTFSPTEWNNLATHPMQSWEWGEVRKKEGKKIVRFVEYGKKDEATAVYLMTTHPLPYTVYSIGYIPKSIPPSKEFLTYLKSYAQEHKLIFVKLEANALSNSAFSTQHLALLHRLLSPCFHP
jgi:lipid II:glycine glycyltransferase (peptidoglycan interpeptide bridge formation enzyme)